MGFSLTLNDLRKLHNRNAGTPEEDWVVQSGVTPIEFLTNVFRDDDQDMKNRIVAAKTVMEYTHKKIPTEIGVSGSIKSVLDPQTLSKLEDSEIETLLALFKKASED